MAVLPQSNPAADISQGVQFQQWPGKTWRIDKQSGRIAGFADDWEAVRQAVEIMLHIERFLSAIHRHGVERSDRAGPGLCGPGSAAAHGCRIENG